MSRPYRRSPWIRILIIVVIATIAASRWFQESQHIVEPPTPIPGAIYDVKRVVDGDTLLLSNGARVRLIGIDTPETTKGENSVEPWGPEATEFTERFIEDASFSVRLEFDKERVDRYGRLLAYVYFGERFLNEELVREGLARVTRFRYSQSIRRKLRKAKDEAEAAGRGIWSMPNP